MPAVTRSKGTTAAARRSNSRSVARASPSKEAAALRLLARASAPEEVVEAIIRSSNKGTKRASGGTRKVRRNKGVFRTGCPAGKERRNGRCRKMCTSNQYRNPSTGRCNLKRPNYCVIPDDALLRR